MTKGRFVFKNLLYPIGDHISVDNVVTHLAKGRSDGEELVDHKTKKKGIFLAENYPRPGLVILAFSAEVSDSIPVCGNEIRLSLTNDNFF